MKHAYFSLKIAMCEKWGEVVYPRTGTSCFAGPTKNKK